MLGRVAAKKVHQATPWAVKAKRAIPVPGHALLAFEDGRMITKQRASLLIGDVSITKQDACVPVPKVAFWLKASTGCPAEWGPFRTRQVATNMSDEHFFTGLVSMLWGPLLPTCDR